MSKPPVWTISVESSEELGAATDIMTAKKIAHNMALRYPGHKAIVKRGRKFGYSFIVYIPPSMWGRRVASTSTAAAILLLILNGTAYAQSDWFQRNQEQIQLRELQNSIDDLTAQQRYQQLQQEQREYDRRHHWYSPNER